MSGNEQLKGEMMPYVMSSTLDKKLQAQRVTEFVNETSQNRYNQRTQVAIGSVWRDFCEV